jgi:phosphate butyryltransferase
LVKGMMQTADLLRAALDKESGLSRGRILSHVGVFLVPGSKRYAERFLLITDAALAIAPSLAQKAEIIQNAIDFARALGIETPVAAVLCAIETVNPAMPATVDAACLSKMSERGQITGGKVEGPLALDNAVSEEAARHKKISSELAGRADILVAPDIEAANILYKSLVFFASAMEAGIVVGAKVPIVVTSRSDTAENKLYSIALGALARASA